MGLIQRQLAADFAREAAPVVPVAAASASPPAAAAPVRPASSVSGLGELVITEGAIIGLVGSLAGAGLGLAAALLPAQALRRLPAAHLLAEE